MNRTLLLATLVSACSGGTAPKPSRPPPPVDVGVVTVETKPVTLTRELPGRTSAFRIAEVRARVNGIVRKRVFEEGTDVKAGQLLFEIDPAPYEAALQSARAQQLRSEATLEAATSQAQRYSKLIESNAVSRQEYEDAIAKQKTAQADLAAARAAVETAEINLGYTRVTAPIAGRIGRSEVTEGAYAQQAPATLLATIQQLDPLYVDLTWSSSELLHLRRLVDAGQIQTIGGKAKVDVVLEDGRDYTQPGTLEFAGASVEPTTGSVSLRAIVPNPGGELMPGMFVRARIDEGIEPAAVLVPQRAVSRDRNGGAVALVVDKTGKVDRRPVVTDRAIGDAWLVTDGLHAGEQVVVEGSQRIRPGVPVHPVPAAAPAQKPQQQAER